MSRSSLATRGGQGEGVVAGRRGGKGDFCKTKPFVGPDDVEAGDLDAVVAVGGLGHLEDSFDVGEFDLAEVAFDGLDEVTG